MPKKGYKQTEEHKQTNRKPCSEERKRKLYRFTNGVEKEIYNEYSSKEEPSSVVLGNKYGCSPQTIKNIIIRQGGKLRNHKDAMSTASCKQLQYQNNSFYKGERRGKNHPSYKGGKSKNKQGRVTILLERGKHPLKGHGHTSIRMNVRSAYAFIESGSIGHMHRLKTDDNSEILKLNLLPGFTLVVSEANLFQPIKNVCLYGYD